MKEHKRQIYFFLVAISLNIAPCYSANSSWQINMRAGELARKQRHFDEAEKFYTIALADAEKHGANLPHLSSSLEGLAGVYFAQGLYSKAGVIYRRAITVKEREFGPHHLEVALSNIKLAQTYVLGKKCDQAETPIKRALTICDNHLSSKTPGAAKYIERAATDFNNLAVCYSNQGDDSKAEELYAIAIHLNPKYELALQNQRNVRLRLRKLNGDANLQR